MMRVAALGLLLIPTPDVRAVDFPKYPLSDWDLQIAGGYYSEGGRYRGGIPRVRGSTLLNACVKYWTPIEVSPEASASSLNSSSSSSSSPSSSWSTSFVDLGNATVCMEWEDSKSSEKDGEIPLCTCDSRASNDLYCREWSCLNVRVDLTGNCGDHCYYRTGKPNKQCSCSAEYRTGDFCRRWQCSDSTDENHVIMEDYNCISPSAGGQYCQSWAGQRESPSRLAAIACACEDPEGPPGDGVCDNWTCKERRIKKCLGMCDMRLSLGLGGTLGVIGIFFLYNSVRARLPLSVSLSLTWIAIAAGGVLFWGGYDGGIYAGFLWAVALLIAVVFYICKGRHDK